MSTAYARRSAPVELPVGTPCDGCRMTAADWFPADESGVRWTVRDLRRTASGRVLCARCRNQASTSPTQP